MAVITSTAPVPPAIVSAALVLPATPVEVTSAPAPPESDTTLMDRARALVRTHKGVQALAVLDRVKSPELAEERDDLRRRALAVEDDAGRP
jgi:hypothetical protein